MLASDLMTEDPVWVDISANAGEAIHRMFSAGVRHLPVLKEGVVVGMLSDRDLENGSALFAAFDRPQQLADYLGEPVAKLMTPSVHSVEPDSDIKDAVGLMVSERIGAVPVVDPGSGKLVGIISTVDVLGALAREM